MSYKLLQPLHHVYSSEKYTGVIPFFTGTYTPPPHVQQHIHSNIHVTHVFMALSSIIPQDAGFQAQTASCVSLGAAASMEAETLKLQPTGDKARLATLAAAA